jgi:hypothetical protein
LIAGHQIHPIGTAGTAEGAGARFFLIDDAEMMDELV